MCSLLRQILPIGLLISLTGCADESGRISARSFGALDDGRNVQIFTLQNSHGTEVEILDLGGIIVSLKTVDVDGNLADITTGFDNPQRYQSGAGYMGALVGRYANRIANGRFSLDGQEYTLAINNGNNAIHGGLVGFDKKIWEATYGSSAGEAYLNLSLVSPDGEEGYPGTVTAEVRYTLNDTDQLVINYQATSDAPTIINLTNHAYFNLDGHGAGSILDHEIMINADRYTPVNSESIPTGEIATVAGTPLDFRTAKRIGRDIDADHEQIRFGSGFDHNFVINANTGSTALPLAAAVYSPVSGRTLMVYTDQPGMQFYTGNFLNGSLVGKEGAGYERRYAFCLETQHYPDSPNKPGFPSTVLRPGQEYSTRTIFEFGIRN